MRFRALVVLILGWSAGTVSAGVLTPTVEVMGAGMLSGTPFIDYTNPASPSADATVLVKAQGEAVTATWPTTAGGLAVPVSIFVNLINNSGETITEMIWETGSKPDDVFVVSPGLTLGDPLMFVFPPPVIEPSGPGRWRISNLNLLNGGVNTVSVFGLVPDPPSGVTTGSYGFQVTATPEPSAAAVLPVLALCARRRRGHRSKSQSGTP